jgi:hypothetical protein
MIEVEAKQVAAFLMREGGQPEQVSALTGVSHAFVKQLGRELGVPKRIERLSDPLRRLWSTRVRILQTSLYGMFLHRMSEGGRAPTSLRSLVDAYNSYHLFERSVIGARRDPWTAYEACLFYAAYVEGLVCFVRCQQCRGGLWLLKGPSNLACPACGGDPERTPARPPV